MILLTHIVDPMWFYWVNFLQSFEMFLFVVVIIAIIFTVLSFFDKNIGGDEELIYEEPVYDNYFDKERYEQAVKNFKNGNSWFFSEEPKPEQYYDDRQFKIDVKRYKEFLDISKVFSISFIVAIISLSLTVVIPSEKTMYRMMVANLATEENVQEVLDGIKEAVDYIVDKVK